MIEIECMKIDQKMKFSIKGTLLQIWKSPYTFEFMQKLYPENFAFLLRSILELFTRKVCILLKS